MGIKFLNGRYYDGKGDFLTLVTHEQDLIASLENSICKVNRRDAYDLVFRNDKNITYSHSGLLFEGTAGIIRHIEATNEYESALFIGDKLGIPGMVAEWEQKPEFGGFSIKTTSVGYRGFVQVTEPASIKFTLDGKPGKDYVFYLNGSPIPFDITRNNDFTIRVERGKCRWQWTNAGVIPSAPVIKNTCTGATWSNIVWHPVTSAIAYNVQMSTDGGNSWIDIAQDIRSNHYKLSGLTDGRKVHVRVYALGKGGLSDPSNDYPVYPTSIIPHAPEGLRTVKQGDKVNLNWGQVLGANKYTLYQRLKGTPEYQAVYSGEESNTVVTLPDSSKVYEFCVTASNGIGESQQGIVSDTDENRIINWYPIPGEIHRRVTEGYEQGYTDYNNWIEQTMPILEYPADKIQ
jgi:hypothetical protein